MLNKIRAIINTLRFPFESYQRKQNILFIHIPKAAGSSILKALGKKSVYGRKHLPWHIYLNADPDYFKRAFKFAFVRHPLTRLYSAYQYLNQGGNQNNDAVLQKEINQYNSFDDFIIRGLGEGKYRNHLLFLPQSEFLLNAEGNIAIDFVGKFENLHVDYEYVKSKVPNATELPHINKTNKQDTKEALPLISEEAKAIVYSIYKQDFKSFDYEI